jgi:hypothetical protein
LWRNRSLDRLQKYRGVAQLVARVVRDDEAAGSSPVTPTNDFGLRIYDCGFNSKDRLNQFESEIKNPKSAIRLFWFQRLFQRHLQQILSIFPVLMNGLLQIITEFHKCSTFFSMRFFHKEVGKE